MKVFRVLAWAARRCRGRIGATRLIGMAAIPVKGKKIKGGISKFWSISHIEAQFADDDNRRLPRCGRGGYKEVSIGLQLEVGVSGYRPKLFSGDSLNEGSLVVRRGVCLGKGGSRLLIALRGQRVFT